ncbi:class I SAM-dependent rRNA methyltransferase [Rhizomicrobium electricum]|uniref:Class I SAM-dependent rRNA methyltransferase n=1 Tax=Rhizomicrobium electricum TaxID=480070 RepID=A0ABP3Q8N7_9PROT|nr:class I SAM-dependent rRNA methyltransferase [Rhizomicrobium electricum]NIJ49336.1 23S rRNA (cytosine1962-C5)-methyltransferase [Rhizomicrobium electricum]
MTARPLLRVKPREGKRARAGAPWLFSNEIEMQKTLAPGTIVNVSFDDGRPLGTGFFNPKSLIAVRLVDPALDVVLDEDFFAAKFARALALRDALYASPFYRLVHAEGDLLPGLVIDRFGDTVTLQITTAGMEALKDTLIAALKRVLDPARIIIRADAPARSLEGLDSYVDAAGSGRISVLENGVIYFADAGAGQKTGWYYDQRDNRAFMAALSKRKSVLDAYSYVGGFGLAAAKAGAKTVVGLESSAGAVAYAEEAANTGHLAAKFLKTDVFEELERLGAAKQTFDVVNADPPPFVKARKDLETGAKAYRKLAKLAAAVTAPEGILFIASCSHNIAMDRFALECAAGIARAGRKARLIRMAGAGPDHPIHPMLPESAYLKALVYALD